MSNDKRKSKLQKKAKSGGIFTQQNYLECVELGIQGKSSIEIVKDNSRQQCQHDLNIQVRKFYGYIFSSILLLDFVGSS